MIAWRKTVSVIGMPECVIKQLEDCEAGFEREKYEENIRRLSSPVTAAREFGVLSELLTPDEGNIKMELCQLYASELMHDEYARMGIDDSIFFETVKALKRFLDETKVYSGEYAVDRQWWSWRQISMTIFRVGALEYEFLRDKGYVTIHIPSDADFSYDSVGRSLRDFIAFRNRFFPLYADWEIRCHSWLMSEKLKELLPADSNIIRFQERFEKTEQDDDSDGCVTFLFQVKGGTKADDLPERTSLQKKAKELMLSGGHIGEGAGVLKHI